jgi:NAD-dependent dihydropyrimidine dehydrogenase PreA subunit
MHGRYTNAYNFAEMLIDLNNYLKVDFHILDGIVAMEGNGPRNGHPTKMNVLMMSKDSVAIDTLFCKMVNLNPMIIPTITYGKKYGLGDYEDIEIIGEDLTSFVNPSFDIDRETIKKTEGNKLKLVRKYVIRRPIINEDICKKCGVCVEVCPVEGKAVNWQNGDKSKPPVYDYDKCIRCYCCQEMCPYHVIDTKTPLIGKLAYKLRLLR